MLDKKPSTQQSEEIAISGLSFIAGDEDELSRFFALSGLASDQMRQAAQNPAFLIAILDYLLGHEPTVLKFAAEFQIKPEQVVLARQVLAGPEEAW